MPLEFLDRPLYGGTLRAWLFALGAAALISVVLLLIRRLVVGRLSKAAARTSTAVDDVLVEVVRRTHAFTIVLVSLAAVLRALDLPAGVETALGRIIRAAVLVQVGFWGAALIGFWVRRHVEQRQGTTDVGSRASMASLSFFGRLVLWALVVVATLDVFFDVRALLTGLGIGGIAVALAAQNILGDLFAAFAIYTDKPFVVGDFIIVDNYMGTVEHIGLKTTRIRSLGGEQIVFGNAELLKSRLRNMRRMYERRVLFWLDVSYDTPDETMRRIPALVREIVEAQSPVRFDRCHFSSFGESALRFETVYWVLDPDHTRHMDIQQAVFLAILERFREEQISFAYPTRTIRHETVVQAGAAQAAAE